MRPLNAVVAVACWLVLAWPSAPAAAALPKRDYDQDAVTAMIRKNTPDSVARGCAEAKRLVLRGGAQGENAVMSLRYRWLDALTDAGRHEEAVALIKVGIDRTPNQTRHIEVFQRARVRCLLALGRHEDALGHAKLYYNVCLLGSSGDAMSLVVECLQAARPGDPELVRRFVEEQVAGSYAGRKAPSRRTGVLDAIKVPEADRAEYARRADARMSTPAAKVADRLALGNYLLLADRPAEAVGMLEEAYQLALEGYWAADAVEAVARALRARDGSVGRANAWAIAHR